MQSICNIPQGAVQSQQKSLLFPIMIHLMELCSSSRRSTIWPEIHIMCISDTIWCEMNIFCIVKCIHKIVFLIREETIGPNPYSHAIEDCKIIFKFDVQTYCPCGSMRCSHFLNHLSFFVGLCRFVCIYEHKVAISVPIPSTQVTET